MSDFITQISKTFNIEEENVLILKRNPMMNLNSVENLSAQPDKRLNQLRVNEGVYLFVEDKTIEYPVESLGKELHNLVY